ncbi:MAG: transketolase, partial [Muribaculaceae bacterium]|nr:transketolase [Muribaculaceae bacterium]
IRNLGGDPQNPWKVFDETATLFDNRQIELTEIVKARRAEFERWGAANPDKKKELESWINNRLPELDWNSIEFKPNMATRGASATVLGFLAEHVKNMIVSSADLANSDKTDGFLKKTHALAKGDFSGAFLQAGVAELTMSCIINGIVLHGAMIGACATFFVFSDYMKPAIRMAALMEIPSKFIFSHDAFRVGEDGPTHEPIEQEAQIRLMEQVRNFNGQRSVMVFRPADSAETLEGYKIAMNTWDRPSVLILSRQDLEDLPGENRREEAQKASKGGYIVYGGEEIPEITLVANGSEVSLLIHVAENLMKEGIKARVVSVPCIGLFLDQSDEYRNSVIPKDIKQFGLTAGLPSNLWPVLHGDYEVYGLERFGASAPAKVLDEKFGYTVENIEGCVNNFLVNYCLYG